MSWFNYHSWAYIMQSRLLITKHTSISKHFKIRNQFLDARKNTSHFGPPSRSLDSTARVKTKTFKSVPRLFGALVRILIHKTKRLTKPPKMVPRISNMLTYVLILKIKPSAKTPKTYRKLSMSWFTWSRHLPKGPKVYQELLATCPIRNSYRLRFLITYTITTTII